MTEEYARLKTAASDLAKSAQAMMKADPCRETALVFVLCSAVASTLLNPNSWGQELEPMASGAVDVVREHLPDKIRRLEARRSASTEEAERSRTRDPSQPQKSPQPQTPSHQC